MSFTESVALFGAALTVSLPTFGWVLLGIVLARLGLLSEYWINRVSRLFRADFNAVLDQIEEPEQLVRQAIRDMEDDISAAEQGIAQLAQQKASLAQRRCDIESSISGFAKQVGENRIQPADLIGGTFTISNGGVKSWFRNHFLGKPFSEVFIIFSIIFDSLISRAAVLSAACVDHLLPRCSSGGGGGDGNPCPATIAAHVNVILADGGGVSVKAFGAKVLNCMFRVRF